MALRYVVDRPTTDQAIAHLAERQHGHVARRQLRPLGVPSTTIDARVRDGVLLVVHHGVYAVGYRRVEPVALAMAAVLAGGDGALSDGDSTLALYGLRRWPAIPEIVAPRQIRRPGIRAHRSTTLARADRTLWLGVPTVRVARAIADMGARLTERQRIRLTNDARLQMHLSVDEQLALLGHDRHPTRSAGEDSVQRWVVDADLPQPLINATVNGHEVDAVWPKARVILELDHPATHSDPVTFASDRRHDRDDRDAGYVTVRLTTADLTTEEAERMRRLLLARGQPGR